MEMCKPKIFVFSPLPPSRNGIADYSYVIVEAISKFYECIIVVADDAPTPILPQDVSYIYLSEYRYRSKYFVHERHLFQVGNNAGHAYMLPWIEWASGVTVVHDATLMHLINWVSEANGAGTTSLLRTAELVEGAPASTFMQDAIEQGVWFGGMGQELTLLGSVARASRAVIVHSQLCAGRVRAASAGVDLHVIPHFTRGKSLDPTGGRAEGEGIRLLAVGFPSRAKRLDLLLDAIPHLAKAGLSVHLTIGGEIRPDELDLVSEVKSRGLDDVVKITGYLAEDDLDDLFASADILVNLRDPTSGESSGTLSRALACGLCAIVTDVGTYSELDTHTVYKLSLSEMEAADLAQAIWYLANNGGIRRTIGDAARQAASLTSDVCKVAERYRDVIEGAYVKARVDTGAPEILRFPTPQHIPAIEEYVSLDGNIELREQLWWRERLLPLARDAVRLTTYGVSKAAFQGINALWGWSPYTCTDDLGELGIPLLAVLDEARPDTWGDFLSTVEVHLAVRTGGFVVVEVHNELKLRAKMMTLFAGLGWRVLRETYGPKEPIFAVSEQPWAVSGWAACFAHCGTKTRSGETFS